MSASFWLAISFCIFVLLAYKPIKNALFKYLDGEIANIATSLADAKKLKEEAEETVNSLKLSIKKIEEERLSLIKIVEEQNNLLLETQQKELDLMINRREKESINRMEELTLEATLEIQNILSTKASRLATDYISDNRKSFPSDREIVSRMMDTNSRN